MLNWMFQAVRFPRLSVCTWKLRVTLSNITPGGLNDAPPTDMVEVNGSKPHIVRQITGDPTVNTRFTDAPPNPEPLKEFPLYV